MWNGTTLALKAMPDSTNTRPSSKPMFAVPRPKAAAIPLKLMVPVKPYSKEMP
jgi:hypothetical protein